LPHSCQQNQQLCHLARHHPQRPVQVVLKRRKIPLDSACSTDNDVIGPGDAMFWQSGSGNFSKAAFHPISDNRVSDLFCDSKANPYLRVSVGPITDKQNKAARGSPLSIIGGQKV
jgi:hypothetical protein